MKKLYEEVKWFLEQKIYLVAMILTAVCSYGFEIVHPIIGIDDTAVELYLQDGLEVVMGRWTVFLFNKVFHMAEFAPFLLEVVGVLFLMLGITLFCVLIKRILQGYAEVSIWGYTIFGCVFLSNPIISEVFIYYYHDGVGLGHILIALALLAFYEAVKLTTHGKSEAQGTALTWKRAVGQYALSMLLLWVAVGCYESLIILYIMGAIVVLFLHGIAHREDLKACVVIKQLAICAMLTVGSVLLRGIMISLLTELFDLYAVEGIMGQRGLSEMSVLFGEGGGLEYLWMLVKRFYLVYYVNAVCYMPVTGYVAAIAIIGVIALVLAVRRKNAWYPILWVGMQIAPFLLTLAEAKITLYRSCQYLPFFTAVGVLLLYIFLSKCKRTGRYWQYGMAVAALILVYNQATMMNKSFYTDYLKYEHTKDTLSKVVYEVEKCGGDKPLVFVGHYETPHQFVEDYYVDYGSKEYQWIVRLTDWIDPHLKEKYFTPYGYSFVGEAYYPFILWGLDAFDGTNGQMIRFLEMHGYSYETVTDAAVLEEAKQIGETMPEWPLEGSVVELEDYILIHM